MTHKEITIFNETILPGKSKTINMQIGKLHTMTDLHIPIIVERSKKEGPVVLLTAGLHGDEINGTEIVRELIVKKINGRICYRISLKAKKRIKLRLFLK